MKAIKHIWEEMDWIKQFRNICTIIQFNFRSKFHYMVVVFHGFRAITYIASNNRKIWNMIYVYWRWFTLYMNVNIGFFDTFSQRFMCVQIKTWLLIKVSLLIFNESLISKTKITYPDTIKMTNKFPSIKHYRIACMLSRH